jgi:tryptophan synthase alpha chain
MNEQLDATLAATKAEHRAALVGYLPAGFPTIAGAAGAVQALIDGGCDIVEIGLPHSDPVLDGPTIQTADDIALRNGIRISDVLATVRTVTGANPAVPVLVMTYWNPVDHYGVARFAADLAAA